LNGLLRTTTTKSGRPLSEQTIAIRDELEELTFESEQMTVRGAFYALTVRGVVDKTEAGYRKVQRQVLLGRREERIPWGFIADGTRWVIETETWDSTEDALVEVWRTYRRNLWRSQGVRIEIWLEKDALAHLISPITHKWGVRLMVSRGQSSDTYCYSAAQDAKTAFERANIETIIYTLYDSDRSGRSAAAQVEKKLRTYSDHVPITAIPLAVTDEQIAAWNLPTRPAKEDANEVAVELDAIPPDKLTSLVDDAIVSHIDEDAWEKEQAVEQSEREILLRLVEEAA
jgi:hypothetical protein